MKRKFFWTIFGVLTVTMFVVSAIHLFYFSNERLRLIDQKIEVVASNILASGFEQENLNAMSELISDALDDEPTLSLVTLYSKDGNILFRNPTAKTILGDEAVDIQARRLFNKFDHHSIRFINFPILQDRMILQVGVNMDSDYMYWRHIRLSVLIYLGVLLLLMVGVSVYLSRRLLRPLQALSSYLSHMAQKSGQESTAVPLPPSLERELYREKSRDEFTELIQTSRELNDRLNQRFQVNSRTSAQMAHELKTPLTIMRNMIETGSDKAEVLAELDRLTQVIQQFLTWSKFEHGFQKNANVHAVKILSLVNGLVSRFESMAPGRVKLETTLKDDFRLFCDPELLEQTLSNLIDNALKYSPAGSPIRVVVNERSFQVWDRGPGLPPRVLEHIGEPFNSGATDNTVSSHGLGLAWVSSIARAYSWKLNFDKAQDGFCVTIAWD